MPPFDPNWFYSSLAQSTAAVVGIVGGLIVSALLRERQDALTRRTPRLVQEARNVRQAAIHNLGNARRGWLRWYEEALAPHLDGQVNTLIPLKPVLNLQDQEHRAAGAVELRSRDAESFRAVATMSREIADTFQEDKLQAILCAKKEARARLIRRLRELEVEQRRIDDQLNERGTAMRASSGQEDDAEAIAGNAGDPIGGAARNLEFYSSRVAALERRAVPRSFFALVVLLVFLTVGGVGLPLAQLTSFEANHKAVFLTLTGLGMLGFLLYVAWEVRAIRAMSYASLAELDEPDLAL